MFRGFIYLSCFKLQTSVLDIENENYALGKVTVESWLHKLCL